VARACLPVAAAGKWPTLRSAITLARCWNGPLSPSPPRDPLTPRPCSPFPSSTPAPQDQAPFDPEDRSKWIWVKAQKWALHIAYRLFTRYANPPRCEKGNDQDFAKRFAVGGQAGPGRAGRVRRAHRSRCGFLLLMDGPTTTPSAPGAQLRRSPLGFGLCTMPGYSSPPSLQPPAFNRPSSLLRRSSLHARQAEAAPQFLEDVLALLHPLAGGGWLAPRCANLALQFVTAAVEEKVPYAALKPHLDGLLLHVALPLLAFNDVDAELWADDPAEFVRKVGEGARGRGASSSGALDVRGRQEDSRNADCPSPHPPPPSPHTHAPAPTPCSPTSHPILPQPPSAQGYDILEDMYSPRTAAQNLLVVVSQKKRKAHLAPFMAHIASLLSAHAAASQQAVAAGRPAGAVPQEVARAMDGALLAIGTCADALKTKVGAGCGLLSGDCGLQAACQGLLVLCALDHPAKPRVHACPSSRQQRTPLPSPPTLTLLANS
jgi:hypothetical protein